MTAAFRRPVLIVEHATTRDLNIDEADGGWTSRPVSPPGEGWRISDASHDRRTSWRRVRLAEASAGSAAPTDAPPRDGGAA